MKRIPVTEEAHREAKAAAAKAGLTLEEWTTIIVLRATLQPGEGITATARETTVGQNGREAQKRS